MMWSYCTPALASFLASINGSWIPESLPWKSSAIRSPENHSSRRHKRFAGRQNNFAVGVFHFLSLILATRLGTYLSSMGHGGTDRFDEKPRRFFPESSNPSYSKRAGRSGGSLLVSTTEMVVLLFVRRWNRFATEMYPAVLTKRPKEIGTSL